MASQIANTVAGDLAGGDIDKSRHFYAAAQLTAMTRLISEFEKEKASNPNFQLWIAKLEHYMSVSTDGDVRGLNEKLTSASRTHQLSAAMRKKHEAAMFVLKHQSSPAAQKIISHLLAKLVTSFEFSVVPLIQSNEPMAVIDTTIQKNVIDPAWTFLESNPLEIDHELLSGLIYFLGGNCHLRWDAC